MRCSSPSKWFHSQQEVNARHGLALQNAAEERKQGDPLVAIRRNRRREVQNALGVLNKGRRSSRMRDRCNEPTVADRRERCRLVERQCQLYGGGRHTDPAYRAVVSMSIKTCESWRVGAKPICDGRMPSTSTGRIRLARAAAIAFMNVSLRLRTRRSRASRTTSCRSAGTSPFGGKTVVATYKQDGGRTPIASPCTLR